VKNGERFSHPPEGAMRGDDFVKLVADMRASQQRWPMHPQQASIETMALEKRVDEAIATGVILYMDRPLSEVMIGGDLNSIPTTAAGKVLTGAHWSDCAVHNEPAFPAGPCNCGADAPVADITTGR